MAFPTEMQMFHRGRSSSAAKIAGLTGPNVQKEPNEKFVE